MTTRLKLRLLAIASAGGHWEQMMLVRAAFSDVQVLYLTTMAGLPERFDALPARTIADCDRQKKFAIMTSAVGIARHFLYYRPDVVFTTGALPGLIAIIFGRIIGSHTIWLDSLANADKLSMSGRWAKRFAHECLSQWEHVAEVEGVEFVGNVL